MKKALIITLSAAVAIALAAACGWLFLNSSFIGGALERQSAKITGSPLKFSGNPEISLFPASITLRGVSWQSPGKEPLYKFSAGFIRASFDLFSFFHKQIHIKEIFAIDASLEINGDAPSPPAASGHEPDGVQEADSGRMSFLVDRVVARDGAFSYFYSGQAIQLSRINLSAEGFGPRREADVKCDFFTNSLIAGSAVTGNMAIRTKLRYYRPNLTFRNMAVTFTAMENPAFIFLSPLSLEGEGALNMDNLFVRVTASQIKTAIGQFIIKGEYDNTDESFSGHVSWDFNMASPRAPASDLEKYGMVLASPVQYEGRVLSFPDIAISAGPSKGSGELRLAFPPGNAPNKISGKLALGVVNLPVKKESGETRARRSRDRGGAAASWPDLDLSLTAAGIHYGNFACKDLQFALTGESGVYKVKDLRFSWASGEAEGSGSADLPNKTVTLATSGKNIDIGEALMELGVDGFRGGTADFDSTLVLAGLDWKNIKRNLSGDINFTARDVRVSLMERIVKFISRFSSSAGALPEGIDVFSVKARAEKGLLKIEPALLKSRLLAAEANGEINLERETMKAELNLRIFGMAFPIALSGRLSDLSWRIEPSWLKKIWREF